MLITQENKLARIVAISDDESFLIDFVTCLRDVGFSNIVTSNECDFSENFKPELLFFDAGSLNENLKKVLARLRKLPAQDACPVVCVENKEQDIYDEDSIALFDDIISFPRDLNRLSLCCSSLLKISHDRRIWFLEREQLESEIAKKTQKADLYSRHPTSW